MPSSSGSKGRVKLSEFHRPPFDLNKASIPKLTLESRRCATTSADMFRRDFCRAYTMHLSLLHKLFVVHRCIQNLAAYRPQKFPFRYPKSRTAAVLVALFVGRTGDIYVLLSR